MATTLTIRFNVSTDDSPQGTTGVDWLDFDDTNDELIFSNGSAIVADGLAIPSEAELNQAGIIISGVNQVVPKYFIADNDAGILEEINVTTTSLDLSRIMRAGLLLVVVKFVKGKGNKTIFPFISIA